MDDKEKINLMSVDASNLLNTLLIYKIAARVLSKEEIHAILDVGGQSVINGFTKATPYPPRNIEKMVLDVAADIENTIMSLDKDVDAI